MWQHLLSTCTHPHIKDLYIAWHYKAVHQILTLQYNSHTRCYTFVYAGNWHTQPQAITIPTWLIKCTCLPNTCTCMAQLRPDILCILRAPIDTHKPILQTNQTPYNSHISHIGIPDPSIIENFNEANPLIQVLKSSGWNGNLLITITTWVRGAFHKQPLEALVNLKIPHKKSKSSRNTSHALS